jgi:short-subunit dehydrogenase
MFDYRNKTVLVTGASGGIGEAFARLLAAKGAHLVLVARSEGKLLALAAELSAGYGIRADVVAADLARPGAAREVYARAKMLGHPIELLVNNAGFATHGRFETLDLTRELEEINLNVTALVELTHAALPDLLARGSGGILNVASTVGFQPVPYMAVYGATKAFVLSFSEALWDETRGRGVTVTALCPGATETGFFDVVNAREASLGRRASPRDVAALGLRAWERRLPSAVHGRQNALLANASRFLPRGITARISGRITRPRNEASIPS